MADMTFQQLADLGVNPNLLQSAFVPSGPAAAPTSQDLAMTSPQAASGSPTPDSSFLTSPAPPAAPTSQDLAAASLSDPNSLIPPKDNSVPVGVDYPPTTPAATTQIPDSSSGESVTKDFPSYHQFTERMFGVKQGQLVRPEDKKMMMEAWTKAYTTHKEISQPRVWDAGNGEKFLLAGNNTPIKIDPKAPTTEQMQLADGTMGRYVTDSKSPEYLKFQPVYDPQTGQPMKAKLGNTQPITSQLGAIQLNDLKQQLAEVMAKAASQGGNKGGGFFGGPDYNHQAMALQAKIEALGSQQTSPDVPATSAAVPAAAPAATPAASATPAPTPDVNAAAQIKMLYQAGKIDRAAAKAQLLKLGFQ